MKKINIKKILICVLGITLARATILGFNPIGIAYFAAVYLHKEMRIYIMPSILLGMATTMPLVEVVKYSIIMLVVGILCILMEGKEKKPSPVVMSLLTGGITALLGITKGTMEVHTEYFAFLAILEGVIVTTLVAVFHIGVKHILCEKSSKLVGNEALISIAIIVSASIYGIPTDLFYNYSVVEAVIFFIIIYFGYRYGSGAGAITGAASGIVLGLQSNSINIIGVMCIIGILAGMFREIGKVGTSIGYSFGVLLLGYFYENSLLEVDGIRSMVSGILLFLLLPKSLCIRAENMNDYSGEDYYIKEHLQRHRQGKLKEFSDSFLKLSNTFNAMSEKRSSFSRQEVNELFDELTDKVCKDCENCTNCWKNNFYDTYKSTYLIFSSAEKNGTILEKDIPVSFTEKCVNYKDFLTETNRIFEIAKLNLIWQNRMAESREAVAGQLNEVASIIDEFSLDLYETSDLEETKEDKIVGLLIENKVSSKKIVIVEKKNKKHEIYITAKTERGRCITTKEVAGFISNVMGKRMRPSDGTKHIIPREYDTCIFVEDTNFKVLSGAARQTKENEKVSGDNFSFMQLNSGQTIMALSDGMGSGVAACRESESVIELLEQLMEAGFKEESAIKLINSVLVLKSDKQSFSTIDMSVIDQYTGVCEFIKIGASTTFIKRDNWVETIRSTTLPVGVFNHVDYDSISKKLYHGDFVIMVSDGIIDSILSDDKEGVIESIIMEGEYNNPQEMANFILNRAFQMGNNRALDDMTVLVCGVWKK